MIWRRKKYRIYIRKLDFLCSICLMFFYFFDRHYGHDRVAQARIEWANAWDFFEARGYGYILCLWEEISWLEQYSKTVELWLEKTEIMPLTQWLLWQKALSLLHWFTNHWFCSYKKAVPLWIWDPEDLIKRMVKKKWKKKGSAQELIVYPNLRSLSNDTSLDLDQTQAVMLHSQSTKKQKSDVFWSLKHGNAQQLVCTYSQMFQDRENLEKITLIDQHIWYYKSQKDPRYQAWKVIDQMWEVYWCEVVKTWFILS